MVYCVAFSSEHIRLILRVFVIKQGWGGKGGNPKMEPVFGFTFLLLVVWNPFWSPILASKKRG